MPIPGVPDRHVRLLKEASALLLGPASFDETLQSVAGLAASTVADGVIIDLDAPARRVIAGFPDPQHAGAIVLLARRKTARPAESGDGREEPRLVRVPGRRRRVGGPRGADAVQRALARRGVTSLVVAPVRADERVVGSVILTTSSRRGLDGSGATLAGALGRMLGHAVDTWQLEGEIAHRRDQAELLARLARRVSESEDPAVELDHVVGTARRLTDSDTAWLALGDATGKLVLRAWAGWRETALRAIQPGPGLAARVVLQGVPLSTGDGHGSSPTGAEEATGGEETISETAVPLRVDGRICGALGVTRRSSRRHGPHEEALLRRLADVAALAIRDQRHPEVASRARGLAKGLAALGRLIADSLEPDDVAQWMTESVCLLLHAQAACLFRWEPEARRLVGVALTGNLEVPKSGELIFSETDGLGGLALRERRAVWTTNVLLDPRIQFSRAKRVWMEHTMLRSGVAAPLTLGETVIGMLVVWGEPGREFEAEDVLLLQTFADQATVVLRSARGGERGPRGAEEIVLREWRGTLQEIAGGARLAVEADTTFLAATEGDPGGAASVVFSADSETLPSLTVAALAGGPWRPVLLRAAAKAPEAGEVAPAAPAAGELVWIEDCRTEPGFAEDPIGRVLLHQGVLTCTVVPLRYLGNVVGLLGAGFRRHGAPGPTLRATLAKLGEQAAVSLAGRRARARLRALAASQERTRIGHELHDMLSQVLFSVALKLDWCSKRLPSRSPVRDKLEEIRGETGVVMRTIREMIAGQAGRPGDGAESDSLSVRLRALVATFRELTGVPVDLALPRDGVPLDEGAHELLFKVFQEALANVAKHARATRVAVRLEVRNGRAEFEIADDGVGLPPGCEVASLFQSPEHFGLRQLVQRLDEGGGRLEVIANAPSGFRISGVLPPQLGIPGSEPAPAGLPRP
jgi:signal transduction histidine kinase/putative methionine-R-sulfoxide reductase with GAF domain